MCPLSQKYRLNEFLFYYSVKERVYNQLVLYLRVEFGSQSGAKARNPFVETETMGKCSAS
jgi:hypothetical protein